MGVWALSGGRSGGRGGRPRSLCAGESLRNLLRRILVQLARVSHKEAVSRDTGNRRPNARMAPNFVQIRPPSPDRGASERPFLRTSGRPQAPTGPPTKAAPSPGWARPGPSTSRVLLRGVARGLRTPFARCVFAACLELRRDACAAVVGGDDGAPQEDRRVLALPTTLDAATARRRWAHVLSGASGDPVYRGVAAQPQTQKQRHSQTHKHNPDLDPDPDTRTRTHICTCARPRTKTYSAPRHAPQPQPQPQL